MALSPVYPRGAYTSPSALCLHLNVQKIRPSFHSVSYVPSYLDWPVLRDAHIPTHVLLMQTLARHSTTPLLLAPVDGDLFTKSFQTDVIPPGPPGTTRPVPFPTSEGLYVSLPVVDAVSIVPHAESFGLLLLFALGFEKDTNMLAYQMLPVAVVDEFPNAAAMAQAMVDLPEDVFEHCFRLNMGLWKNVLSLGVNDVRVVDMVRTAFNVTAEARRLRMHQ